eukprot:469739_1
MGNTAYSRSSTSQTNTDETFIIEFNKNKNNCNSAADAYHVALCSKRVVFVSLIGLFQTYNTCPSHVLYSSLLLLPLRKKWVYSSDWPRKYISELKSVSSSLIRDDARSHHFFELIKWKDSQGLVIWAFEHQNKTHDVAIGEMALIHPFWKYVSQKLISLYDVAMSKNYEPLPLDTQYWTQQIGMASTTTLVSDIIQELYFMPLNYACIKRIFDVSNPESFRVITHYCSNGSDHHEFVVMQRVIEDDSDVQTDDEWWISSDYLHV